MRGRGRTLGGIEGEGRRGNKEKEQWEIGNKEYGGEEIIEKLIKRI